MSLTSGLAIYSAILSTLLALIEVLKFYKDRANIKVTVRGGYNVYPANHPKNPYGDKDLVLITASNKGKRPVALKKACLLMPRRSKRKYLLGVDSITSIDLTEGKSHDYYILEDEIKKTGLSSDKYIACVIDATGRYHWSHNIFVRFLKLHRIK